MSTSDDIQKQHDVDLPEQPGVDDSGGEGAVSGHAPDPGSDDDVTKGAKKVGIYDDTDQEQELNVAEEIEKDEEGLKDIPPEK